MLQILRGAGRVSRVDCFQGSATLLVGLVWQKFYAEMMAVTLRRLALQTIYVSHAKVDLSISSTAERFDRYLSRPWGL